MKNKKLWKGILAMALVFGMAVVGCEEPTNEVVDNYVPQTRDDPPLTGTVTVTSNVNTTANLNREVMTLTADTSGLDIDNPDEYRFSYQWMRDGSNVIGSSRKTYEVTEADYGKTLRVRVTYSSLSGEQFGELAV
jgi:hypothetical protein